MSNRVRECCPWPRRRIRLASFTGLPRQQKTSTSALRFDLAIMTAHVFQVFLDDAQTLSALSNIHRHMAAGGKLVFESRNPLVREWESWTRDETRETRQIDGIGACRGLLSGDEGRGRACHFRCRLHASGDGRKAHQPKHAALPISRPDRPNARAGGFQQIEMLGWWDGSAFEADSKEIIVTAYA